MPRDFMTPVLESAVTPLKWRMYMDICQHDDNKEGVVILIS